MAVHAGHPLLHAYPVACQEQVLMLREQPNLCKCLFDSHARVFPHHVRSPTTMFACRRSSWFASRSDSLSGSLFDSLDSTLRLVRTSKFVLSYAGRCGRRCTART